MESESTSKPKPGKAAAKSEATRYRAGDPIVIEVEGYEQPFEFAVSKREYEKFLRQDKRNMRVIHYNFLRGTSQNWDALEPLLDESSADFDLTLQESLVSELTRAIGLDREVTVKKP